MAIAVGQRFVRRNSTAKTSVSNTVVADYDFDTAIVSEGGYGAWTSAETSVDTAGKYLCVHGPGEVNSTGVIRSVGTNSILVNGASQGIRGLTTHRYIRVAEGADEGVSFGAAILDLAASDAIGTQIDGNTYADAVGGFNSAADSGDGLQLLRLPDNDYLDVQRTSDQALAQSDITATRPWVDASGSWTKVSYPTEINDDGGWHDHAGAAGDVVIPANTKVLIVGTYQFHNTDNSRCNGVARLVIGGTVRQWGSAYHRETGRQGGACTFVYLHETGGSPETMYVEATMEAESTDNGILDVQRASLQVIDIGDTAEWIHVDNGATDSLTTALAGTTTWYTTPLSSTVRADGNSNLVLDSVNNAVENDSGGPMDVMAIGSLCWDRDSTSSGARKVPASRFNNNSFSVQWGWGGAYSRGQHSNDDTWIAAYTSVAMDDLAGTQLLRFETRDQTNGSNSGMGVYASGGRSRLVVQVLDLSTISTNVGGTVTIAGSAAAEATTLAAVDRQADIGSAPSAEATTVTTVARTGAMASAPSAEATTSATATRQAALAATPAAEATTSAIVARSATIQGTPSAEATTVALAARSATITAAATAEATTSATIAADIALSASASAEATTSATASRAAPIAAAASAPADTLAIVDRQADISGTAATEATTQSSIARSADLAAAPSAQATTAATISSTANLSAAPSAEATTVATVSRAAATAGSATAEATTSALSARDATIAAAASAEATTTGTLAAEGSLTATVEAEATTSAALARSAALGASPSAEATTIAVVSRLALLAASPSAEATTTASAVTGSGLAASAQAEATTTTSISRSAPIAGSAAAEATTLAAVDRQAATSGAASAEATSSASISSAAMLSASPAAEATTSATATRTTVAIAASASAEASTNATVSSGSGLAASASAEATTVALVDRAAATSASAAAETTTAAEIQRVLDLAAAALAPATSIGVITRSLVITASASAEATTRAVATGGEAAVADVPNRAFGAECLHDAQILDVDPRFVGHNASIIS